MNHHGKTNKSRKASRRFKDEDSTDPTCCQETGDPWEVKQITENLSKRMTIFSQMLQLLVVHHFYLLISITFHRKLTQSVLKYHTHKSTYCEIIYLANSTFNIQIISGHNIYFDRSNYENTSILLLPKKHFCPLFKLTNYFQKLIF